MVAIATERVQDPQIGPLPAGQRGRTLAPALGTAAGAAGSVRGVTAAVVRGTAMQAIAQRPWGFLRSAWPWRSLAYLVTGVVLGAATSTLFAVLAVGGAAL